MNKHVICNMLIMTMVCLQGIKPPFSNIHHSNAHLKDISVAESMQMTMTTKSDDVTIGMWGSGTVIVDWGDGTDVETKILSPSLSTIKHTYSDSIVRTIIITGNYVRGLDCDNNKLISLDVSRNTILKGLGCSGNKLANLDVNRNSRI